MNDHASYIGIHERCLRDLMDEGFDLPTDGAILTYRDRRRDCLVTQIYPFRAAAEARRGGAPLAESAPGGLPYPHPERSRRLTRQPFSTCPVFLFTRILRK